MIEDFQKSDFNFRTLGKLISNSGFERFLTQASSEVFIKELKNLILNNNTSVNHILTAQDVLDHSYSILEQEYRHEYIYKTKLLSDFILKKYSLAKTLLLNEFKIGNSKADLVIVNGRDKVFEIKTELDNPERLKTQIDDYYKCFSEVYIVTHHSLAKKYSSIIDENVGLIVFTKKNAFKIQKDAKKNFSKLNGAAMMKALRKSEFFKIITDIEGSLPEVKPVFLYKECLALVEKYDSRLLQSYFLLSLKARIKKEDDTALLMVVPDYLKFYCYVKNFKQKDYLALPVRLSHRI